MERERSAVRRAAMLEQIDALPGAQDQAPLGERDRELGLGERGADVGGHVVGALVAMPIERGIFRSDAGEEALEVGTRVAGRIFLHEQGRRAVTAENGEETLTHSLFPDPGVDTMSSIEQSLPCRLDLDPARRLAHRSALRDRTRRDKRRPLPTPRRRASMGCMKHIGILTHSAEGATLCYRTAWLEGVRRLGPHHHPEITMTGIAMHHALPAWERGDLDALRALFAADAARLAAAGADFFVLPDNSAHIALEAPGDPFPLPCLHIAEVVAEQARRDRRRRVAILGTEWTMQGPVYPGAFGRRGIAWDTPGEDDRAEIHRIIFDELCLGIFTDASRATFVRIIETLAAAGCDAAALVCTEIPLLIAAEDSPLPILDSTRLLATAAVEVALGERPMPGWRGGPVG